MSCPQFYPQLLSNNRTQAARLTFHGTSIKYHEESSASFSWTMKLLHHQDTSLGCLPFPWMLVLCLMAYRLSQSFIISSYPYCISQLKSHIRGPAGSQRKANIFQGITALWSLVSLDTSTKQRSHLRLREHSRRWVGKIVTARWSGSFPWDCLLVMLEAAPGKISPTWPVMPKHELNKNNVDMPKWKWERPQDISSSTQKLLAVRHAESRRSSSSGRAHRVLMQYRMVGPENTPTQVTSYRLDRLYLGTHMHMHVIINEKKVINLKEQEGVCI